MTMLLNVFVVLVIYVASSKGDCPSIIGRSEWGARPPKVTPTPLRQRPAPYVVVHHADTPGCTERARCAARVRSIQDYHQDHQGWDDIGYNFLVGEDGNVYEGRGWNAQGAHAPRYNDKSIGVCFLGTFSSKLPNSAALEAVKSLIQCGVDLGEIRPSGQYKLLGHRQVRATDCPGESLYDEIKTWSGYEPNP